MLIFTSSLFSIEPGLIQLTTINQETTLRGFHFPQDIGLVKYLLRKGTEPHFDLIFYSIDIPQVIFSNDQYLGYFQQFIIVNRNIMVPNGIQFTSSSALTQITSAKHWIHFMVHLLPRGLSGNTISEIGGSVFLYMSVSNIYYKIWPNQYR